MAYSIPEILGAHPIAGSVAYEPAVRRVANTWEGACPVARATTYYFDSVAGSDANPGTEGSPFLSIDKMIEVAAPDVTLLLKRGSLWREASAEIDILGGAIGAYAAGDKPVISGFTQTIAAGVAAWTNAAGNRWSTSNITDLGWLREQGAVWGKVYRQVANTAEVEATEYSFFADGAEVHVNPGAGIDPNTLAWEGTPAAGAASDTITTGVHGGRVDGLVLVGRNCRDTLTASYAVKFTNTGDAVCSLTDCDLFYHSRHNAGQAVSGGATGGRTIIRGCRHGWINESGGLDLVTYASDGLNEAIFLDNEGLYGVLPSGTTRDYCEGTATICHTDVAGANKVGAFHVVNHRCPSAHQFGFAAVFNGGYGPEAETIDEVRLVCHRAYLAPNYGTAQRICADNTAIACSRIHSQVGPATVTGQAIITTDAFAGFMLSSYYVLDISQIDVSRMSIVNPSTSSGVLPNLANNHIHMIGDGDDGQICFFNRDIYTGDSATYDAAIYNLDVSNNLFTATNMGNGEATPGLYNAVDASNHVNNAFFGVDYLETDTRGASNWRGNIGLDENPADPLNGDNEAPLLRYMGSQAAAIKPEVDLYGRELAVAAEAIGPYGRLAESITLASTLDLAAIAAAVRAEMDAESTRLAAIATTTGSTDGKLPADAADKIGTLPSSGTVATSDEVAAAGAGAQVDIDDEPVAEGLTAYVERRAEGLVDVAPLKLTAGDGDPGGLLVAIDFSRDLVAGGRITDVIEAAVASAPEATPDGLEIAETARRGPQAKLTLLASAAGDYVLRVKVRYRAPHGPATAYVRVTVAPAPS